MILMNKSMLVEEMNLHIDKMSYKGFSVHRVYCWTKVCL